MNEMFDELTYPFVAGDNGHSGRARTTWGSGTVTAQVLCCLCFIVICFVSVAFAAAGDQTAPTQVNGQRIANATTHDELFGPVRISRRTYGRFVEEPRRAPFDEFTWVSCRAPQDRETRDTRKRTKYASDPRSARTEDVSFTADCDGTQQKYVLVYPHDSALSRALTMLIVLHGHGADRWQFVRNSRDECRAVRDVAVAHGMLLVAPDYRAKTSWMGPKAEADVVQIIAALKQKMDIERVIIAGGSMGGTGALAFAALHPELVDGVVALNGTADLVHYKNFGDAIARSYGGSRKEVPDQYRRRSALFFPDRFTMPLAATTGGRDATVPAASVLSLLADVRKRNAHVLSIHRPAGGHSSNYEDTKKALEYVVTRSVKHRQ